MIRLDSVSHVYGRSGPSVRALDDVSLDFHEGTFTAVMGPSGSGKTTLLHCAAGMDRPTEGSVWWDADQVSHLGERRLALLRRRQVGFVFQAFNLIPSMTVAQNVALPSRLAGARLDGAAVRRALDHVGLADRARHRPAQLSGGQQQRVAIARALVARPRLVFADEPTGALDRRTGREILELLRAGVDEAGQTCVMVTHDPLAAGYADRVVVRWEALVVVAAVTPVGWVMGAVGARWFLDGLQRHGYAPSGLEIPGSPLPFILAVAVTAAIATAACAVGVRRVTRLTPSAALSDSASEPREVGWFRALLGGAALVLAGVLVAVGLAQGGTDAAERSFVALLVTMAALGLLGPLVTSPAARLLGTGPRLLSPRIGWLADANTRGHARRLASAVIPMALLVALACNFLFVGPTMDRATAGASRELTGFTDPDENWLRLVELGMFVLLAGVAIVNTLVALTADRRQELRLLKLLGASNRDVWRMLGAETLLIVLISVALGTVGGGTALVTFSQGVTGSPLPSVPMASYGAIVAATAALAAPSILLTGGRALAGSASRATS